MLSHKSPLPIRVLPRIAMVSFAFITSCQAYRTRVNDAATATDSIASLLRPQVQAILHSGDTRRALQWLDTVWQTPVAAQPAFRSAWYRVRGGVFMQMGLYDSALACYRPAHEYALMTDSAGKYLIEAKLAIMNCFSFQHRADSALPYGMEAYQLALARDSATIARAAAMVSQAFTLLGDTMYRYKYLEAALRYTQDSLTHWKLRSNMANYYYDIGKLDTSLILYRALLNDPIAARMEDQSRAPLLANMGFSLFSSGDIPQAINLFKEAITINQRFNIPQDHLLLNIAEGYIKMNDWSHSRSYLDTAITNAKAHENWEVLSDAYGLRGRYYRHADMPALALQDADSAFKYHRLQDSTAYLEKAQEIETVYSVRAKDADIRRLQWENDVIQQRTRQQQLLIIALVIITVLGMMVVALLWRRRKAQQQQREMELRLTLLRNFMGPHFMSNALGVGQSLLRRGDTALSERYFEQLAHLLRFNLENAQDPVIALVDEVAVLNSYLALQELAYEQGFTFTVTVFDGYQQEALYFPPMLLQPFVENAVLHGVGDVTKGHIDVSIEKRPDGMLECVVEDNGPGILSASQSGIGRHTPLSFTITEERLAIWSKQANKKAWLTVESNTPNHTGVRVILHFPYLNHRQI